MPERLRFLWKGPGQRSGSVSRMTGAASRMRRRPKSSNPSADPARSKNNAGSGPGFTIIRNFTALLGGRVELADDTPGGLIVRVIPP